MHSQPTARSPEDPKKNTPLPPHPPALRSSSEPSGVGVGGSPPFPEERGADDFRAEYFSCAFPCSPCCFSPSSFASSFAPGQNLLYRCESKPRSPSVSFRGSFDGARGVATACRCGPSGPKVRRKRNNYRQTIAQVCDPVFFRRLTESQFGLGGLDLAKSAKKDLKNLFNLPVLSQK